MFIGDIDRDLFLSGNNSLDMINAGANLNGNYGLVGVWKFQIVNNTIISTTSLLNSEYNGGNGVSFNYTFNNPE
jgi:hypothetical protein